MTTGWEKVFKKDTIALTIKKNLDKLGLLKIKNFCLSKHIMNKVNIHHREAKMFEMCIFSRKLVLKINNKIKI